MNVRRVSVTAPCIELCNRAISGEELIVYCARVSNPANQTNLDTAPKLLSYCIRNKHWSVFEMVHMTVEIKTSRAIAQQILRHRSFSFQEFSQRYAEVTDFEKIELRKQAKSNRQGGEELLDPETTVVVDEDYWGSDRVRIDWIVADIVQRADQVYRELINAGVAKECARFVLPLCTQTTLYMCGSVRSWIHYLQVRRDGHAQKEHRLIADAIYEIFKQQFPNIATALETHEDQT